MSIRERWDRWWNTGKYEVKFVHLAALDRPGYPVIGTLELDHEASPNDVRPFLAEWDRLALAGPIPDGMRIVARTPAGTYVGATFVTVK